MLRLFLGLVVALSPVAASAQDWRNARTVELRLTGRDISPASITVSAGEPVRLRFYNAAAHDHRLAADGLLAASRLRSRDAQRLAEGTLTVPAGEAREVVLVPAEGRYRIRSTNWLYRLLGMSSEIIVGQEE
ncbi:cupredoxin domain-containing protein [Sphingomonas sp. LY54]|uniref:cupredoxin domain-containing protein n=1 Tax=Sphingomonas sp. LY54 TaxID=3095343 RepID=UPI002D77B511|nr:cupredoxin domain-containing protein [Sphingomonas sp. LY54]WRP29947.1 cupredoxin domain-containing protein [Sphingomonas sp. LY54]